MCHNCNQVNDCNCNNTVPCQKCNTPACNSVCRFTGENINGLGILKNEDISTAIEKIAEYLLNNVPLQPSIVKLQDTTSPSVSSTGYPVINNSSVLQGTSFTATQSNPTEYDLYYEGQANFVNASELVLGVYKNNILLGYLRKIKSVANTIVPFSISVSDTLLSAGDIVDVRASKINSSVSLENCTIKIVKR